MTTHLSVLQDDIIACSVCSYKFCRNACAVYEVVRSDAVAPSGFNHFALGILQGMTHYTPSAAEALYKCTDCGACRDDGCVAPGYGDPIDTPNVILALRADAVAEDVIPDDVRILLARLRQENSLYEETSQARASWLPATLEPGQAAAIYLWAGCSGYRHVEGLTAAARLLEAAGVAWGALGRDERCCGLLAWQLGDRALATEQARSAIQDLANRGVRELIVAESGCYRLFKSLGPQVMGLDIPFAVYHLSEYVQKLVEENRLTFSRPVEKVVAYHDAGQLGAQMGVYDAPRGLLSQVPGLQWVEMPHNRGQTRGSGQGAGFELLHPATAQEMATRRLKEASRAGAEWLVTACPAEAKHLTDAANGEAGSVQVKELSQLLIDALQ